MKGKQGEIHRLKGVIQHYSWGGYNYIPGLLGLPNDEHRPHAEYWLGAHPNHPATIDTGKSLNQYIEQDGEGYLGKTVFQNFHGLPYLLKILDVRQMLSIQVHPDKKSAERKFAEENQKGIAINASNRNYKDDNHKPEMMIALSDFRLLHGFKNPALLRAALEQTPELTFLIQYFQSSDYRSLYEYVMRLSQEEVDAILEPLDRRISPRYKSETLPKNHPDFWAARAIETFCRQGHYDRGIFSIYLFNLVYLQQGEGIFQAEGLPHAYLEGQNVEVMANSDNVLRAGLTDKHIDVEELLQHVRFEATDPKILTASQAPALRFDTPAKEFELHQYNLSGHQHEPISSSSVEMVLVVQGSATLRYDDQSMELAAGDAAMLTNHALAELQANGHVIAFRVAVPAH